MRENATELAAAADDDAGPASKPAGGLLAFGNGGSATDAMDVVADLRLPEVAGWRSWPALDLTEDTAIITAVANDVGVEEIFQRQVIAYGPRGRRGAGFLDQRWFREPDRGPGRGATKGDRHDCDSSATTAGGSPPKASPTTVIISRSQHIPRIQEAQASAYHLLRELVEEADVRGVGG